MLAPPSQRDQIETLRRHLAQAEAAHRPAAEPFSSGSPAWDRILPGQAFHRGTLVEFLTTRGCGAATLALVAAREACRQGGSLVVIDRSRTIYPPAAANLGIEMSRLIFVRPRNQADQLWAMNQSLRCPGVSAVLCWPERLDDRAFRSLQLAAEAGGAVGLFVRQINMRGHPSWSDLQFLVEALPVAQRTRRLRIELIRCRNGKAGASVELELDDETGTLEASRSLPVAAQLAHPAPARLAPGA
jgi:protein ImuA